MNDKTIAFFDSKDYDREVFNQVNQYFRFNFKFF